MQALLHSNSFVGKLKFFLTLFKQSKSLIIKLLVIQVFFSIGNAIIPYFTKLQIDQLESQSQNLWLLKGFSPHLILFILLVIPPVIELLRLVLFERINTRVSWRLRTEMNIFTEKIIWDKLESLDFGFFQNKRNQRILSAILNSTRVGNDFFEFIKQQLGSVVTLVAILPLLGLVSWQLLLLAAVVTVAQAVISELSRKSQEALKAVEERQTEKYWKIYNALTYNFYALKVLGASPLLVSNFHHLARERDQFDFQREDATRIFRILEWGLHNSLILLANVFVGYQVLQGNLSIGTFTLVVSYTVQINNTLHNFIRSVTTWKEIDMQLDRLKFFLSLKPRITWETQLKSLPKSPTKLTVSNVSFTYPDLFAEEKQYLQMIIEKTKNFLSSTPYFFHYYSSELKDWQEMLANPAPREKILKGVNFHLKRGKIVALLGRNGAGKTTMTHLLMHHYEPTGGEISLDGQIISSFEPEAYLQLFGVVQQQPVILQQFSVKENLTLGLHHTASEKNIWKVLDDVGLVDAIQKLPQGLDTVLGENVSLSGGQEQAIAVARVLLQKRPFLIFDEGMNQMDIERETKIVNALKAQTKHAGVLFITHRITTARKADYIYMLDDGKITEKGTHEELLKADGLYAKFWRMHIIE